MDLNIGTKCRSAREKSMLFSVPTMATALSQRSGQGSSNINLCALHWILRHLPQPIKPDMGRGDIYGLLLQQQPHL